MKCLDLKARRIRSRTVRAHADMGVWRQEEAGESNPETPEDFTEDSEFPWAAYGVSGQVYQGLQKVCMGAHLTSRIYLGYLDLVFATKRVL